MTSSKVSWSNPEQAKFKAGQIVLIKVKSDIVGMDAWIAEIVSVGSGTYTVKCLTAKLPTNTRIPWLFEKSMSLISNKNLDKTLKAIRILYETFD